MPSSLGRPQLPQGLSLDLPDPFARDVELLTDLLERMLTLAADPKAQADDLLLFRRQRLEELVRPAAGIGPDQHLAPQGPGQVCKRTACGNSRCKPGANGS